jgi:hypothetical protein
MRPRILEKVVDKFTDELEITKILEKVRESYDLFSGLKNKKQKMLSKYGKTRTIDLEESSCSHDS